MALPTGASAAVASLLSLLTFAGMQLFKSQLGSSQLGTIAGGVLGSVLFVLLLTGMNNVENAVLGKGFQAQVFPEVLLCLVAACLASGMVHRVCVTTCLLLSIGALFAVNSVSQRLYAQLPAAAAAAAGKKKKK